MNWKSTNDIAFAIATETTQAVNMARALVRDAEIAATAKVRSVGFTQCRGCQALLENFMIEYPDCSDAVFNTSKMLFFSTAPPAQRNITRCWIPSIKNTSKRLITRPIGSARI